MSLETWGLPNWVEKNYLRGRTPAGDARGGKGIKTGLRGVGQAFRVSLNEEGKGDHHGKKALSRFKVIAKGKPLPGDTMYQSPIGEKFCTRTPVKKKIPESEKKKKTTQKGDLLWNGYRLKKFQGGEESKHG